MNVPVNSHVGPGAWARDRGRDSWRPAGTVSSHSTSSNSRAPVIRPWRDGRSRLRMGVRPIAMWRAGSAIRKPLFGLPVLADGEHDLASLAGPRPCRHRAPPGTSVVVEP